MKKVIVKLEEIKNSLYITAYTFMKNENDALEIVSQSIFIILKKYKQLKHKEYFKTWATRIVINQCKKELKRKNKYKEEEEIVVYTKEYENLSLKEALNHLPDHLRVIVELKYFQGYTLKEMSFLLNKPISTIASQLQKALELLKIDLKEDSYE